MNCFLKESEILYLNECDWDIVYMFKGNTVLSHNTEHLAATCQVSAPPNFLRADLIVSAS